MSSGDTVDSLIRQLDEAVSREDAGVVLEIGHEGTTFEGNRRGFLRLGIELLKAALHPPGARLAPIDYVLSTEEEADRRYPFRFVVREREG